MNGKDIPYIYMSKKVDLKKKEGKKGGKDGGKKEGRKDKAYITINRNQEPSDFKRTIR